MNDKAVIIVTGASRGVGAAAAAYAARLDAGVVLNARSGDELQRIASDIESLGAPVEVVTGDLHDARICEQVIATAVKRFGRIDGLVNNAGVLEPLARIDDFDLEHWEANWRVNVLAPVLLASLALPYLRKPRGRVINISSGAAVKAYAGWAAYCAAKAALNLCTEALAVEEPNVTAIALRPGMVDTDMQKTVRHRGAGVMSEGDYQRFTEAKEQGDLVPPDEVGRTVAVLALFAKPEWSGSFLSLHDDPVRDLVSSKGSLLEEK